MSFPEYADLEKPLLCYIYFHGGSNYRVETGSTYRPPPSTISNVFANTQRTTKHGVYFF